MIPPVLAHRELADALSYVGASHTQEQVVFAVTSPSATVSIARSGPFWSEDGAPGWRAGPFSLPATGVIINTMVGVNELRALRFLRRRTYHCYYETSLLG